MRSKMYEGWDGGCGDGRAQKNARVKMMVRPSPILEALR